MTIRVEHGDCLDVIPQLVAEGELVDAIVTDPPYGLEFMGKEWDSFADKPKANWNKSRADHMSVVQTPGRFQGHTLPKSPGASGLLNSKCLACGKWKVDKDRCRCETPQFDLRFRKGAAPAVRAFQSFSEQWAARTFEILKPGGYLLAFGGSRTHHRLWCAIEDAGFVIQDTIMWLYGSGFPKGRTQLKPAFEPICVAYKPGGKRELQIDEGRVATTPRTTQRYGNKRTQHGHIYGGGQGLPICEYPGANARWPANVCHDGSDEVMEAFAAFGTAVSGHYREPDTEKNIGKNGGDWDAHLFKGGRVRARFFYCAKADVDDRWGSKHPTVKPVQLIRWLVRLVTPPQGTVLDCFAGSGTTAVAAMAEGRNAILIEREAEYIADIRARVAHYEGSGRHSMAAKHRSRSNSSKPMPLLDLE